MCHTELTALKLKLHKIYQKLYEILHLFITFCFNQLLVKHYVVFLITVHILFFFNDFLLN